MLFDDEAEMVDLTSDEESSHMEIISNNETDSIADGRY